MKIWLIAWPHLNKMNSWVNSIIVSIMEEINNAFKMKINNWKVLMHLHIRNITITWEICKLSRRENTSQQWLMIALSLVSYYSQHLSLCLMSTMVHQRCQRTAANTHQSAEIGQLGKDTKFPR
jgi:hypothetical protein